MTYLLNIGIRLVVQLLVAGIGGYFIGENNDWPPAARAISFVIMTLFILWMTNLYNFMGGINGLAALEAISICMGIALIYWMQNVNHNVFYLLIIIAASTGGFLFWSFPEQRADSTTKCITV